jgi:hypothetical protein
MDVTESPMLTEASDVHELKASPMDVTELGMLTEASDEHE